MFAKPLLPQAPQVSDLTISPTAYRDRCLTKTGGNVGDDARVPGEAVVEVTKRPA